MDTAQLKKVYKDTIAPELQKQFNYSSAMQIPVLKKIVINMGLGDATQDKKIVDVAINEITAITGQKAVATYSKKDIANFKLRKKMPIGVMVTLRRERMYEFLEKLVRVALPRIRDFKGIESKLDGRGNYTLGIQEQIEILDGRIKQTERQCEDYRKGLEKRLDFITPDYISSISTIKGFLVSGEAETCEDAVALYEQGLLMQKMTDVMAKSNRKPLDMDFKKQVTLSYEEKEEEGELVGTVPVYHMTRNGEYTQINGGQ